MTGEVKQCPRGQKAPDLTTLSQGKPKVRCEDLSFFKPNREIAASPTLQGQRITGCGCYLPALFPCRPLRDDHGLRSVNSHGRRPCSVRNDTTQRSTDGCKRVGRTIRFPNYRKSLLLWRHSQEKPRGFDVEISRHVSKANPLPKGERFRLPHRALRAALG